MEDLVKKEPIVPTLRELQVGESHCFPIEQRSSVYVSCQRMVKEGMRTGWNYLKCWNTLKILPRSSTYIMRSELSPHGNSI